MTSRKEEETWLFVVEWFDPMPQIKKRYLLKYFVQQNQAEMVDLKSKKLFLKKSPCPPEVSPDDFFIGGKVLVYSRELEIVDYGDGVTRSKLHHQMQQTTIILSPNEYQHWGKIIDNITARHGFGLVRIKSLQMPPNIADNVCGILEVSSRRSSLLSGGVSVVLVIQNEDGIARMLTVGESLNKQFGCDFLIASNGTQVADLQDLLFDSRLPNSSTLDSCTCCVIKPHAVKSKQVGAIIDLILTQGYELSAIRTLHFDKVQAEEFLEVYKGVVPEYGDHVVHMCSGMSVALEVRAEDAVTTFRQTAGPWDVDMAKELRPGTIRASYGVDIIRSAVHCTDLDSDGISECEYCFRLV